MSDDKSPEKAMLEKLLAERAELDQHIAYIRKRLDAAEFSDQAEQIPPEYSTTIQPGDLTAYSRTIVKGKFSLSHNIDLRATAVKCLFYKHLTKSR